MLANNGLQPEYKNYTRQKCFVAYSHNAQWKEDLFSACNDILPQFGLEPWYASDQVDPTQILLDKVVELIANSRCGIYDISYWWNKKEKQWEIPGNVFIELGIAIALNRPTLLLRNQQNKQEYLPECFKSISNQILEFSGESSLLRILEEYIPHWIKKSPEKSWWNRYCFFGNQVCQYRETHPQLKQFAKKTLNCPILDSPEINCQDFRDSTEKVLNRFSKIAYTYVDDSFLTENYQFLLCNHCQTIRSSPFAIYRIARNTPPEVFISLGMSIALEKQFEYEIPRIIVTEDLTDIPSLLNGYEVIKAKSDKENKRKLSKFIPAVLNKVRETSWKPRALPFIDSTNLLDEESEQEEQQENDTKNFKIEQTIYIANLDLSVTQEDINEVFSEYGTVEQVYLPIDSRTNRKRGFAFIAMSTKEETAKAAETLDGAEWMARELTVRIATPNEVNTLEPDNFTNENETRNFQIEQTIYIANLDLSVTQEDINEVFSEYGTVEQIYLPIDSRTNRKRGFAFIAMSTKEETAKAAETLDGAEWMARELTVRIATPNEVNTLEPDNFTRKNKIRVYELSKELNLDNKDIKEICDQLNIIVKSHSSTITPDDADRVRAVASNYPFRRSSTTSKTQASVNTSIYIGNLNYEITQEDINEVFSEYGIVKRIHLPIDRETGRKRGFAFVEMAKEEEAIGAIEALDGAEWMGREIRVNKARPRTNNSR